MSELVEQINFAMEGRMEVRRSKNRWDRHDLGEYYLLDEENERIVATHVDLKTLAHKLDVNID